MDGETSSWPLSTARPATALADAGVGVGSDQASKHHAIQSCGNGCCLAAQQKKKKQGASFGKLWAGLEGEGLLVTAG